MHSARVASQSRCAENGGASRALLQTAAWRALAKQRAEDLLLLKLMHRHSLTAREIARMWGWPDSAVNDAVRGAEERTQDAILAELRCTEAGELAWDVFVQLCHRYYAALATETTAEPARATAA